MGIQKCICSNREKERENQGNVLVGFFLFLFLFLSFEGKNRRKYWIVNPETTLVGGC